MEHTRNRNAIWLANITATTKAFRNGGKLWVNYQKKNYLRLTNCFAKKNCLWKNLICWHNRPKTLASKKNLKPLQKNIRDILICCSISLVKKGGKRKKEILGDALATEKTSTCNYNTYSNECVHKEVRDVMLRILAQEHEIQNDVFNMMHERGLYPTPGADEKKLQETKSKFAQSVKNI